MTTYSLPKPSDFAHTINGKNTHLIILTNRAGMQVALTDYGARLVSALVPDKRGNLVDVVLGFDSIHGYLGAKEKYHGATIGRFGNRIANGKFNLDGTEYTLAQNNGPNSLHGGEGGFHSKVWDRQVSFKQKVDFYYVSPDGEEGFPGEVKVKVCYELTNENEIIIRFRATTDKPTVINLTNHAYFNLNGEGNSNILDHLLQIPSTHFIPIDDNQIPFGNEAPVENTPFDFRTLKKISQDIGDDDLQIKAGTGYDHTFINPNPLSQAAATAYAEDSGIQLQVYTTEPGIQLYTGNFLSADSGKSGNEYQKRGGFCFEAQHYPDSPNQPNFPNVVLRPGEEFQSQISYKFNIVK
ncbi:galactose mutarotase [Sphingobacterium alkalisoli]|uniref:Aldose 1-epimerase n=1 Tax=Sphingobacterium alkalisoli TaxID=1874115 RepID=A0A4U0H9X8_9SPHI|nr:aldose epimerase family protein [Sphingobacterium alkalisoli]TJY68735.1 galactose mutarotase [Sphingobacterium alkalisoli]GGH04452.1 aldose 1-epimerase [Sphingobacterium alkalisoli]